MAIDRLGQKVEIGEWCAITQHNEVYVGKVVKEGNSVTIALNLVDEFIIKNNLGKNWKHHKDDLLFLQKAFPSETYIKRTLSFVRDNKFIKITPTRQMELDYENLKKI